MFKSFRKTPIERNLSPGLWQGSDNFWYQFSPEGYFGATAVSPLALPAFYRGLRHRTGIISSLPLQVEVGDKPLPEVPDIIERPDPSEDRNETVSRLEASLVLRGEIVCVLGGFDEDGFPSAIKVVDPCEATLNPDGSWMIGNRKFEAFQVLHRIALAVPGETRGLSVVDIFRRQINGELIAADFQNNFYRDGAQPTVIVKVNDQNATPEDIDKIIQRYMAKNRGGRREPLGIPNFVDFETHSLTNKDSQFLESRQFAMTDIANMVGVPPYFIGAPGSSSTYSNITDQRRDLLDIYLRDDIYLIERAFSSLLPEGMKVKFNPKSFLRLDPKAEAETLAVQSQWMTIDEIRAVQGLDPLPGGAGTVIGSTVLPGSSGPSEESDPASEVDGGEADS